MSSAIHPPKLLKTIPCFRRGEGNESTLRPNICKMLQPKPYISFKAFLRPTFANTFPIQLWQGICEEVGVK